MAFDVLFIAASLRFLAGFCRTMQSRRLYLCPATDLNGGGRGNGACRLFFQESSATSSKTSVPFTVSEARAVWPGFLALPKSTRAYPFTSSDTHRRRVVSRVLAPLAAQGWKRIQCGRLEGACFGNSPADKSLSASTNASQPSSSHLPPRISPRTFDIRDC